MDFEVPKEEAKGQILSIGEIGKKETKFGERDFLPVRVSVEGKEVDINLWVDRENTKLHPKSNAYGLLKRVGVKKVSELVGKEVALRMDENGFWRFDV